MIIGLTRSIYTTSRNAATVRKYDRADISETFRIKRCMRMHSVRPSVPCYPFARNWTVIESSYLAAWLIILITSNLVAILTSGH